MIRSSGSLCRNRGMEVGWACCSRHRRTSLVHTREQFAIMSRRLLMLSLNRQRSLVMFTLGSELLRGRTRRNASVTAVVADAIDCRVVHNDGVVVDIGHVGDVHVSHAAVVIEVTAAPLATVETLARISEAVVNTAIEANVRSPVAATEDVKPFIPSPPSWSPEHSHRGDYPSARHPVVAIVIVPGPVPGCPQIAGPGTDRLRINRQCGRTDSYRNSHRDLPE